MARSAEFLARWFELKCWTAANAHVPSGGNASVSAQSCHKLSLVGADVEGQAALRVDGRSAGQLATTWATTVLAGRGQRFAQVLGIDVDRRAGSRGRLGGFGGG